MSSAVIDLAAERARRRRPVGAEIVAALRRRARDAASQAFERDTAAGELSARAAILRAEARVLRERSLMLLRQAERLAGRHGERETR